MHCLQYWACIKVELLKLIQSMLRLKDHKQKQATKALYNPCMHYTPLTLTTFWITHTCVCTIACSSIMWLPWLYLVLLCCILSCVYLVLLYSTTFYHGCACHYLTLLHHKMALFHSALLYYTIKWLYFTLLYPTWLYYTLKWLYFTLFYPTRLYYTLKWLYLIMVNW